MEIALCRQPGLGRKRTRERERGTMGGDEERRRWGVEGRWGGKEGEREGGRGEPKEGEREGGGRGKEGEGRRWGGRREREGGEGRREREGGMGKEGGEGSLTPLSLPSSFPFITPPLHAHSLITHLTLLIVVGGNIHAFVMTD
jgi:hypothetical protein